MQASRSLVMKHYLSDYLRNANFMENFTAGLFSDVGLGLIFVNSEAFYLNSTIKNYSWESYEK